MRRSSHQGQSPIESVIATGLLVIAVVTAATALNSYFRLSASLRDKTELDEIRLMVQGGIDCKSTIQAINVSGCQTAAWDPSMGMVPGITVTLLRPDSQPLFTADRVGAWLIQTKCLNNANEKSLVIYVSKRDSVSGPAKKDAANQSKVLDWVPLFRLGTPICHGEVASPTTPPASNVTYQSKPFLPMSGPYVSLNENDWSRPGNCDSSLWPWFPDYYATFNHVIGTHHLGDATCPVGYAAMSPANLGAYNVCWSTSTSFVGNDPRKMAVVFPCAWERDCIGPPDPFELNSFNGKNYRTTFSYVCVRTQ